MTLRQRFAAWLCAPLQKEIEQLRGALGDLTVQHSVTQSFCKSLAEDLNRVTERLHDTVDAIDSSGPRVRVAKRFSDFAAAASMATARKRT